MERFTLDQPFQESSSNQPDSKRRPPMPDFSIDEPFDLPGKKSNISKADRSRIEAINREIKQEADLMESERQRSVPPEPELSEKELDDLRKQSLLEIAWSEVTGQTGQDIEVSWKNYFHALPDKIGMLAAIKPTIIKKIVRDVMEPRLVDMMAEDHAPNKVDIDEIEPLILKALELELAGRKTTQPRKGDFFQTGTD